MKPTRVARLWRFRGAPKPLGVFRERLPSRLEGAAVQIEPSHGNAAGFELIAGFLKPEKSDSIARWLQENIPWSQHLRGASPPAVQYPKNGPFPPWATEIVDRMITQGVIRQLPNHLQVVAYRAGRGMYPHVDRATFGDIIVGLTLGSSRVMELTPMQGRGKLRVLLQPGDLYVIMGEARHLWRHGIPETLEDEFGGRQYRRCDGFSATWRRRLDSTDDGSNRGNAVP